MRLERLHHHLGPHARPADADVHDIVDGRVGAQLLGQRQHVAEPGQQRIAQRRLAVTGAAGLARRHIVAGLPLPPGLHRRAPKLHMQRRPVLGGVHDLPAKELVAPLREARGLRQRHQLHQHRGIPPAAPAETAARNAAHRP
jgi:hypothetical protein